MPLVELWGGVPATRLPLLEPIFMQCLGILAPLKILESPQVEIKMLSSIVSRYLQDITKSPTHLIFPPKVSWEFVKDITRLPMLSLSTLCYIFKHFMWCLLRASFSVCGVFKHFMWCLLRVSFSVCGVFKHFMWCLLRASSSVCGVFKHFMWCLLRVLFSVCGVFFHFLSTSKRYTQDKSLAFASKRD